MYKWLMFDRKDLLHVLCRHDDTKVKIPSVDDIAFYKEAITATYPFVLDVWGTNNGLTFLIQDHVRMINIIHTTMDGKMVTISNLFQ